MDPLLILSLLMILSGLTLLAVLARKVDEFKAIEENRKLAEAEETMDRYNRHARENELHVTRFLNSERGKKETAQAINETQASKQ